MTRPVLTILREARKLISDPKNWTQYAWARRANSSDCDYDDPKAVKWCATGAIAKATKVNNFTYVECARARLMLDRVVQETIITINDSKPRSKAHKRILDAFDQAIEKFK